MKQPLTLLIALLLAWSAGKLPAALPAAAATAGNGEGRRGELRVGFGQVDITPPVGALMTGPGRPRNVGAEDPLLARTLVAQCDQRTIAIVGVDLVKVRLDLVAAAIAQASERTGIARDAVLLCPSHNHSSPFIPMGGPDNKDYLAALPGLIAASIEQAFKARQPARMWLGRSLVYDGLHNRRVVSKADGLALNTWLTKLDDLTQTPQVLGTEGPIDPELWVARFDAMDGRVLGTLVNFTCHPHLRDRKQFNTWSADFPGVVAEQIAAAYGKQAVCVFTQGASGNINPNAQGTSDWREKAAVFAKAAVAAAQQAMPIHGPVAVGYARRDVVVPCRDPADQRDGAIARLGWRADAFASAKRVAAQTPRTRKTPVSAVRVGPLGIATNPGELFVEWGLAVKQRSPFPHTIVCELTDDWIGYEPTTQAFQHEGYETPAGVDFVSLAGIQTLVDTAVELLHNLREKE